MYYFKDLLSLRFLKEMSLFWKTYILDFLPTGHNYIRQYKVLYVKQYLGFMVSIA
jgi:hypothetical protein